MEAFVSESGSLLAIFGSVGVYLASRLATKYIIPFLKIGKRQKYAEYVTIIADEVTDDLRVKYPQKKWLKHLDEAIDTLVAICAVSPDIARRAVNAAATRK